MPGLVVFFDSESRQLEIVAADGLPESALSIITDLINGQSVGFHLAQFGEGLIVPNLQKDGRLAPELARDEGLRSALIAPVHAAGRLLGAVLIFSRTAGRFSSEDFELVSSAVGQIGVAARQAESYEAEKRKLVDAEKMRMAGLLASGVAHNFNNVLQAVMGQASLLEMQLEKGSRLRESAGSILASAQRGAELIRQLQNFSSPNEEAPRIFSLEELIEESRELWQSVLGSSIHLTVEFSASAPSIRGDYRSLQQLILNLLVNAREAIGENELGSISVRGSGMKIPAGERHAATSAGNYLCLEVIDSGCGMSPEGRARCFEPFYTTKETDSDSGLGFAGSGLGLAQVYSIVNQHGGNVQVQSAPGAGTSFRILLPAEREYRGQAVAVEKIVVVDEEPAAHPMVAAGSRLEEEDSL